MKATAPLQPKASKSAITAISKTTHNPLQLKKEVQNPLAPVTNNQNPLQLKENKTGLPNNLKTGVETLAGISMDDVQVHYNSNKPAQLQALAYAQGTDIHIAPGQEKHLPHEVWHVVQQKQGRVSATMQLKGGVNVNNDKKLEKEADVMGRKAVSYLNTGETARENKKLNVNRALQLKVIDNNLEMDVNQILAHIDGNPTLKEKFKKIERPILKMMLQLVVNSSERLTLTEVCSLTNSSTFKIPGLASIGKPSIDASKLKNTQKKLIKLIKGAKGSGFETALEAKKPKNKSELFTDVERGQATTPADTKRREDNLKNLLKNLPKVKIKKGTWLMHMTKSSATDTWMKESMIGQHNKQDYSFFTLYTRGAASAHANSFGASLVYSLKKDVFAFYIQDYEKILVKSPEYIYSASGKVAHTNQSTLNLGSSMAETIISDLPVDKRPLAFVSPSEHELVFFNGIIPDIMAKEGLVTSKDGSSKDSAKLLDPENRKFEKFNM